MVKSSAQHSLALVPEPEDPGQVVSGGYLVRDEQLKLLGNGDVKQGRRWLRLLMADTVDPKPIAGPTPRPATVRLGTPDDELAIFDMLVSSYKENASNVYPLAPKRLLEDIQRGTEQRDGGLIGVIDGPDGAPVAAIVLGAAQWPASNAWFLKEMYTYVRPEHRKSRHAENLIKFARWCSEEWTKGFGYPVYLGMAVATQNGNVMAKIRFFKRFAQMIGAHFLYPAPGKTV